MLMHQGILIIDNNCLNRLERPETRERLRANLRATGRVLVPTGVNAVEAAKTSDPDKRGRLLATLGDLAQDRIALPLAERVLRKIAEAIASNASEIEMASDELTSLFREPEAITEERLVSIRNAFEQQEATWRVMLERARREVPRLIREFKADRKVDARAEWVDEASFLNGFWMRPDFLERFLTPM